MKINTGISEKQRLTIVRVLSALLADTYTLYLNTHKFHWNVTGPMFNTLHLMFEQQYLELFAAVDLVAERIRALGELAPGSYTEFKKLGTVKEAQKNPVAEKMIEELLAGHEALICSLRKIFPIVDEAGDEATADLITQRLQIHEKTAWMLRSLLG